MNMRPFLLLLRLHDSEVSMYSITSDGRIVELK